jgi:hypothetical protein
VRPAREKSFLPQAAANSLDRPLLIGELAGVQLGVDQFAVDGQLEAAASRWDQFQLTDLLFVRGEQLARQTDGLRLVVSHRTVTQFDVQGHLLSGSLLSTRLGC